MLLQRLGPLRMGEQSRWDRAPKPRGLWAFPWPMFEMFFAYHQYANVAPIRLRTSEGLPTHHSAYVARDGSPAPRNLTVEELRESPDYRTRDGFWDEVDQWVRTVGRQVVRRHQFWFGGELYAHLTPRGEILGLDQWHLMPATTFAAAVRRSGADLVTYRAGDQVLRRPGVADHLEVFIAAGAGQLAGRSPARNHQHR